MDIVARFTINNREYVYFIKGNSIQYGCINGDNIRTELTTEEISLMNELYNQITISKNKKNHIRLVPIVYHSKNYHVIFDKISKLKYVLEITPSGLKEPDNNEVNELLYFLNNERTYTYENKTSIDDKTNDNKVKQNFKNIRIKRKVGGLVLTVYLSSFLLSLPLGMFIAKNNIFDTPNNKSFSIIDAVKNTIANREYEKSFSNEPILRDDIIDALNKNTTLSQEYKDRILICSEAIIDNYSMVAKEIVLERISTLKVVESYGKQSETGVNPAFSGTYTVDDNTITIYAVDNNNIIIDHEIFHIFGYGSSPMGCSLYEATNELFRTEYSGSLEESYSYREEKIMAKLIMEIIGTDAFMKLEFYRDISDVITQLTNVINDKDLAQETVVLIDVFGTNNYQRLFVKENTEEYTELLNNLNTIKSQIIANISRYYNAKYQRDINDDIVCATYINAISPEQSLLYIEGIESPIDYVEKAYFRDTMIDELSDGVYHFVNNNEYEYDYDYVAYTIEEAKEKDKIIEKIDENGETILEPTSASIVIFDDRIVEIVGVTPRIVTVHDPIQVTSANKFINQDEVHLS